MKDIIEALRSGFKYIEIDTDIKNPNEIKFRIRGGNLNYKVLSKDGIKISIDERVGRKIIEISVLTKKSFRVEIYYSCKYQKGEGEFIDDFISILQELNDSAKKLSNNKIYNFLNRLEDTQGALVTKSYFVDIGIAFNVNFGMFENSLEGLQKRIEETEIVLDDILHYPSIFYRLQKISGYVQIGLDSLEDFETKDSEQKVIKNNLIKKIKNYNSYLNKIKYSPSVKDLQKKTEDIINEINKATFLVA